MSSNTTTSLLPPDILEFNTIANATTCQTINVSWDYTGESNDTVEIGVFGYTAPGADPTNPTGGSDELEELINANISITAEQISWQVNVPPGEYQIQAYDVNDVLFGSTPFFVNDGDTSCMGALSTWITPTAQPNGSSGSKISSGAIAGIVIGVVAAIVAAIILLVVYARKRRMARLASRDRRGWTSLNSLKAPLGGENDAAFPKDNKVDPAITGTAQPMTAFANEEKNMGALPVHDF